MPYLKKIIISLFLFTLSLQANNLKELTTFEASFTQTITNPSGSKVLYNGLLYISSANKIKWQYNNPIKKYVYIKKYTVTIIEPELEQAIITKLNKEINILELLNNATKISKNHYISIFNNVDYKLILENEILKEILYKDEIDNNVSISFKNVQQNHKIDDKIFKFRIPLDFDIIKK